METKHSVREHPTGKAHTGWEAFALLVCLTWIYISVCVCVGVCLPGSIPCATRENIVYWKPH